MAEPPAGASLLFGALADSGRIKQRKNGSYRMVLKGIDEIDWFTDRKEVCNGEGIGKEEQSTQVSWLGKEGIPLLLPWCIFDCCAIAPS